MRKEPRPCQKCGDRIPSRLLIDGCWRTFYSRKFCFTCSPFKANNKGLTRGPYVRREQMPKASGKVCQACGDTFSWRKNNLCLKCLSLWKRYAKKKRAIAFLGGKCHKCGQDDFDLLAFHHRDPTEKSFAISLMDVNWNLIETELRKCDLLCIVCHTKHHAEGRHERIAEIEKYMRGRGGMVDAVVSKTAAPDGA